MGVSWHESGAVKFFLSAAIGVIAETAVQHLTAGMLSPRVRKAIGFVWVGSVLMWITPFWGYPNALAFDSKKDGVVPYSVVRTVLGYLGKG